MTTGRPLPFLSLAAALLLSAGSATATELTGRVTGEGTPLPYVQVWLATDPWGSGSTLAQAGADGTYSIVLSSGTYYARTYNEGSGYVDECYPDVPCPGFGVQKGQPIAVSGTTMTLDFDLSLGGRIGGVVRDADTKVGIREVGLYYHSEASGETYIEGTTGTDGTWVTGMAFPAGNYHVYTVNFEGYFDELYEDKPLPSFNDFSQATPVPVTAGAVTNLVFELKRGAQLVGSMTDADTGLPVPAESAWVSVVDSSNRGVAVGSLARPGQYSTGGFPAGTYYVKVGSSRGYRSEVYEDQYCTWPCDDLSGATTVTFADKEVKTLDFVLEKPDDLDDDGIADTIDYDATTGEPTPYYSNDFSNKPGGGSTHGTITSRGGFDVKVREAAQQVRVSVTGSGAPATLETCPEYGPEGVTLDASGESVLLMCYLWVGSTYAFAEATTDFIVLRDPPQGAGVEVLLPQYHSAVLGSPVEAGQGNADPIDVRVRDAANAIVGTLQLEAEEKVDVSITPQGSVTVAVLEGAVDVTIRGVTQTLEEGQAQTFHPTPDQVLAPLPAKVDAFLASGDIRRSATANTIKSQIATARTHIAAGRTQAAISTLEDLLKYLDAQVRAGQIKPKVRDTLAPDIRLAIQLLR